MGAIMAIVVIWLWVSTIFDPLTIRYMEDDFDD